MTTAVHPNSVAAFRGTTAERATLESRILDLMKDGAARSDRKIAHELDWTEPLRPRITNLVHDGRLHEVGDTICEWTGKKVRLTKRFL